MSAFDGSFFGSSCSRTMTEMTTDRETCRLRCGAQAVDACVLFAASEHCKDSKYGRCQTNKGVDACEYICLNGIYRSSTLELIVGEYLLNERGGGLRLAKLDRLKAFTVPQHVVKMYVDMNDVN